MSFAAMKSSAFSVLQKVGQSLMIPVSVLPAAGLAVGIGRLIEQQKYESFWINAASSLLYKGGIAVFENLALIFAIGVAVGFSGGAGIAGLSAAVGYYTFTNILVEMQKLQGIETAINTGVFGGIFIGLLSSYAFHKFEKTQLHPILGFFSGKRLVPIVMVGLSFLLGIGFGLIWPKIQHGISEFGVAIMNSQFGPALYAAGKRLLIPLGLHHVYYAPYLFDFGSFTTADGGVVHGDLTRYFAGDKTAGIFMASEFPIMIFGLPMAAFAMYIMSPKSRRKSVSGVMIAAALTSILTGITEPIEFAFIFVAPILYIAHVMLAFLSGYLTSLADIHLGSTFSPSLIDYFVGYFNQTNGIQIFTWVGPIMGALYFVTFCGLIKFFNLKTPGRDDAQAGSNNDLDETAQEMLAALGGPANIKHLDACITRLRLTVYNDQLINFDRVKSLGASGHFNVGGGNIQIVMGTLSDILKDKMIALTKSNLNFVSPIRGEIIPLNQIPDAVFSQGIMGEGFGIKPTDGEVYSPVKGSIIQLFKTKHAIGILSSDGAEVLIHVGIDTVKLKGEGFTAHVKVGDQVNVGTKLISFDLNFIEKNATSTITPVVITNKDQVTIQNISYGKNKEKSAIAQIKEKK
jgi:glucose-specific phosphotransferase system IIA component